MEDLQGTVGGTPEVPAVAAAAPSWFPAETAIEAAPAPAAVEAPPAPEERTSAAEAAATAAPAPEEHTNIKLDGEIERLGTFATAGAAATYDSAR